MTDQTGDPKETDGRDADGRFTKGNKLGKVYQPGVSGNPKGRPPEPKFDVTAETLEMLDQPCNLNGAYKGLTWRQAITLRGLRRAVMGKTADWKHLLDRLCGKVVTPVAIDANVNVDVRAALLRLGPSNDTEEDHLRKLAELHAQAQKAIEGEIAQLSLPAPAVILDETSPQGVTLTEEQLARLMRLRARRAELLAQPAAQDAVIEAEVVPPKEEE